MKIFVKNSNLKLTDIIISLFFITLSCISIYVYIKANIPLLDFNGNRIISKYVLCGIDPLKYIGKAAPYDGIEAVPYSFGGLPYGLLLGNLFYFGFLDLKDALFCFRIETLVLIILTIYFAIKFFKKYYKNISAQLIYYFILFTIFSINIFGSLNIGNIGHMISMLIIISIFTARDNIIISSICLALAMVKPQIAFPFCICFLFCKKYINVFVAALIDIVASCTCAYMVNENVIVMFKEFLEAKVGGDMTSYGLFSILFCKSGNYYAALMPSMIFSIILLIVILINLKHKNDYLITFSFGALISKMWSYNWSSDYFVMILPAMAFIYLYLNNQDVKNLYSKIYNFVFIIFTLTLLLIWPIKHVLKYYLPLNIYLANILHTGRNNNIFAHTYTYIIEIIIMFVLLTYYNSHFKNIIDKN